MRFRALFASLTILTAAGGSLTGCSDQPTGPDLPKTPTASQEEIKKAQDQVKEGMKGMYKGAPGVPIR